MRVELNNLITRSLTRVLQLDRNRQLRPGPHRGRVRLEVIHLESGIAKTVAKGVERRAGAIPITCIESIWNLRKSTRIEDRNLTHAARPTHRKFSSRICIAEEQVRNGIAALSPGIPRVEDSRHMLRSPRNIERAPVEKHQHDWLSGGHCRLEQLLLTSGKSKCGACSPLTTHGLGLPQDQHSHLRLFDEIN